MTKIKEKRQPVKRKILILISLIGVIGALFFVSNYLDKKIPNNIKITLNKDEEFNFDLPLEGKVSSSTGVLQVNDKMVPGTEIKLNLRNPFTLKATDYGNYQIDLKLFGLFNYKQVNLDVVENIRLMPAGDIIGINIETDGIMVLGTGVVTSEDGLSYEPALNKLCSGDYITAINGKSIESKEELIDEIDKSQGDPLLIQVRRNKEYLDYNITPIKSAPEEYKIGIWVRDDTQGIGTLTFITEKGEFGALGHGITDVDTSQVIQVGQGNIFSAEVMAVVKGQEGKPGELIGAINKDDESRLGKIKRNTSQGIFGQTSKNYKYDSNKSLTIGLKQDVRVGPATILSCVDSEVKEYDILIEDVTLGGTNSNKGIVIKIIDEELNSKSGGIVQGMSGSPIIQNGKIIGAVTHVFIQDSTKGYGTFIENMIFNME